MPNQRFERKPPGYGRLLSTYTLGVTETVSSSSRMNNKFASPAAIRPAERIRQSLQAGGRGSVVGVATPRIVGQGADLLVRGRRRVLRCSQQIANLVTGNKRKPHGERLGAQRLPILEPKNHVQAYVGGEFHLGTSYQARESSGSNTVPIGVAAHLAMAGRGASPGSSIVSSSYRHTNTSHAKARLKHSGRACAPPHTPRTSRPVTPNHSFEPTFAGNPLSLICIPLLAVECGSTQTLGVTIRKNHPQPTNVQSNDSRRSTNHDPRQWF